MLGRLSYQEKRAAANMQHYHQPKYSVLKAEVGYLPTVPGNEDEVAKEALLEGWN